MASRTTCLEETLPKVGWAPPTPIITQENALQICLQVGELAQKSHT
ncbi:hypothetical protein LEMLEM_LOCUS22067 [Lemmus lemmus]